MKKIYATIITLLLAISFTTAMADQSPFQFTSSSPMETAIAGIKYNSSINFIYTGSGAISVNESGLPSGISANPPFVVSANNYSIALSGTPTQIGSNTVTVTLSDSADNTSLIQSFALTVRDPNALNGNSFGLKVYPMSSGIVGINYQNTTFFNYFGSSTPTAIFTNLPAGITQSNPIRLVPTSDTPYNYEVILSGVPVIPGTYQLGLTLSDGVDSNNYSMSFTISPVTNIPVPTPTPTILQPTLNTDPVGTNISSNGTVYMITPDNQRRAYTSAGAFLSYGFNSWTEVLPASSNDLSLPVASSFIPPRDGKIVCSDRGSDKGTCYLITNSQKAAFTSAAVFKALGFNFTNSLSGDVSFLPSTSNINSSSEAHRTGVLINKNGTVYLVGNSGLLGIPSMDTLNSWGYSLTDIVKANTADSAEVQTGVMTTHQAGLLSPF